MKRIPSHLIGVDQGDVVLFSEYENGGSMWTGHGARERRMKVKFSDVFRAPPVVHVSTSLLDIATGPSLRADITTDKITVQGFEIVFRTWEDSRVARIRAAWMAIGPLENEEEWELY
ncbi:H-type lectin domain-containing protein [Thalassococcus sp. S3]|uniref:H-type lectin domain-containing protein n=1 Tax=Thalassococcus sp. S3 TaxID=2017482 RepID=UPI00102456DB|nr:H-type lectin domain-containing protein [Thalassococcus sp. S3]QBF30890.1 hypothetical protein CFI11_06625 [Thalassococcus sp. S3]